MVVRLWVIYLAILWPPTQYVVARDGPVYQASSASSIRTLEIRMLATQLVSYGVEAVRTTLGNLPCALNFATAIKSCGQQNYCCQPSGGNFTSCCEERKFFDLEKSRVLTVIPERASTSRAASSSAQPSTSSLPSSSTISTTSSSTAAAATSTLRAPISPTATPQAQPSSGNNSTTTGLAAGLGITLGLALIGGLLVGLYKWDQRRRMRKQPDLLKGSPDSNAISLPTPIVETNGHQQWEMSTNENAHEASLQAQTGRTPSPRFGF
ncbi:MAG: hypothetical protein Q9166_007548 [cf. Caloplaca sp. 2 TL-2023]